MSTAIDIALVLIVAFAAWRGFKNGLIRGLFGVVAIVVAIYGANLVAQAYSGEFTGVLDPFIGGIVDKAVGEAVGVRSDSADVVDEGDEDGAPDPDEPIDRKNVYDVSFAALRTVGVSKEAAARLAGLVDGEVAVVGQQMSSNLAGKLSGALAHIAVFGLSFIIIAIIFAVLGNIINLAFSLPGIEMVDHIIGLILGIMKGLLIVFALAVIVRYVGLLPRETMDGTTILKYIVNDNPLANILGI